MIGIEGNTMPRKAQVALGNPSDHSFSSISSMPEVRHALAVAQNYRCAYCERKLKVKICDDGHLDHKTKIEHFHPQSGEFMPGCRSQSGADTPESACVSWRNLLLVCEGTHFRDPTCDSRKGSTDICSVLQNPKNLPPLSSQVRVNHDGTVDPVNDRSETKAAITEILGLNDPNLCSQRARAYATTLKTIRDFSKNSHKSKARIKDLLERRAREDEFGSVYITLLNAKDWGATR